MQESDFNKYDAKAFVFVDLQGCCCVFKPLKERGFVLLGIYLCRLLRLIYTLWDKGGF
jgi:hypothetical protein